MDGTGKKTLSPISISYGVILIGGLAVFLLGLFLAGNLKPSVEESTATIRIGQLKKMIEVQQARLDELNRKEEEIQVEKEKLNIELASLREEYARLTEGTSQQDQTSPRTSGWLFTLLLGTVIILILAIRVMNRSDISIGTQPITPRQIDWEEYEKTKDSLRRIRSEQLDKKGNSKPPLVS